MSKRRLREPLPPTYAIERQLIEEHDQRLKRARSTWPGRVICPDTYRPANRPRPKTVRKPA